MRQTIMRFVSKNNARNTLLLVTMAIVACGLLIGCPDGGDENTKPNLTITSFTIEGDVTSVAVGGTFTAKIVVRNAGTIASPEIQASFAVIDSEGMLVKALSGTITVPAIMPGMSTEILTGTITVPADTTVGANYRLSITLPNTSTPNNSFLLGDKTPTIFEIAALAPDLQITAFTSGVTSVAAGGVINPMITVRNSGTIPSPTTTTVSFALVNSAGAATALDDTIMVPIIMPDRSTSVLTGPITIPLTTTPGMYFLSATVAAVTGETARDNNSSRLGGTPSQPNFTITEITTTFNLAHSCLVIIGDADNINCTAARDTNLTASETIGTVMSTDATAFALVGSNDDFAIGATTGIVTAKRTVMIDTFSSPVTFNITVTEGVGAGTQRVRIINDASAAETRNVSGTLHAPVATAVTLFRPGESAGQPFACSDQGGSCITSLQTENRFVPNPSGWYRRYNSGVTGEDSLDVTGYSAVHIEYNLNTNTLSPPPPTEFTVRLGYTYFRLMSSDGVVGDSMWRTFSMPLTRRPSSGMFFPRYVSNIGFIRQGNGVSLSVRAVYFR